MGSMTMMSLLDWLSVAWCGGIGLFALWRSPRHLPNWGFSLGMLSLGLMELGHARLFASVGPPAMLFWSRVALAGEILAPVNWLLFSLTFARGTSRQALSRWQVPLLAIGALSLAFLVLLPSENFLRLPEPPALPAGGFILGESGKAFHIFSLLCSVLILLNLESTLLGSRGSQREQIKYTVLGVGLIFAFFVYLASQRLLFPVLSVDPLLPQSMVLLLALGILTFGHGPTRLKEMDLCLSRPMAYRFFMLSAVGTYLLATGLAGEAMRRLGWEPGFTLKVFLAFASGLGMAALLLSEKVRRKAQAYITRHFYRERYDYRAEWLRFTAELGSEIAEEDLGASILEAMAETFGVEEVSLWSYEESQGELQWSGGIRLPRGGPVRVSHPLTDYLREHREPIEVHRLRDDSRHAHLYQEVQTLFEATRARICMPLVTGERVIGVVTLGEEITGRPFDEEDFSLLKTMTAQAASVLSQARLFQESIVSREMEAFHRLSSFVLHDMKNLVSMLSLMTQNAREHFGNPEFQQEAFQTVSEAVDKMNRLIASLSDLPRGAKLMRKPEDLNALAEETISQFHGNGYSRIEIRKVLGPVGLVEIEREGIERVLVNLLQNAAEALAPGKPGTIEVRTSTENGWAVLTISDNGCGMSQEYLERSLFRPFRSTKRYGLGIGLFQCRTIVAGHGGQIEAESREGSGTTFRVRLPQNGANFHLDFSDPAG
ncbi:MAG: PEP-CTERM system histidine kinase PrsK [Candidatus Tectomicrobia bacterium]|uniref:histidine kinase n=1 Tax=Tectimicrobiota bacterium TaxID=2528274 RepID=A0A932FX64_UNCTE|nr:PEP-CTERM system histidine kinase PrsK [Candidatus Tectomicrobia bacterium]